MTTVLTFLLRVLAVLVVIWLVFRLLRALRVISPPKPADGTIEMLVRCAHCGTYVPRSEAFVSGDALYCSAAHRDRGRSNTT